MKEELVSEYECWGRICSHGYLYIYIYLCIFHRLERKVRRRGVASGASGGRSLYLTNFGSQEKKPMYQIEGGP